ncbi:MAG TPA: TlyA family RNA methyltransferase [bacterium]|nr:TlyA family RNA methyltransferase [bacterium]
MKKRADLLLVERGLAGSRNEAQALLLAGQVFSSKGRIEKAGQLLPEDEIIEVKEKLPFVGRGGLKLDHALKEFGVEPEGFVCLDIGASTGGFTDCLLQRGAKKVYAVDVGYGQLHMRLREDPRVVMIEKTNFRHIDPALIPEEIDLTVIDVSFISLSKVLPNVKMFLKAGGRVIALVKPQFELGPKHVKKGVVRSDELREKAVADAEEAARALGFEPKGRAWSPIEGAKGNRECLIFLSLP